MTVTPIAAATAVVYRMRGNELEVVMCRRSAALQYLGGAWVFPGGRVDLGDAGTSALDKARSAAVRETYEETALEVRADALVYGSHWTTPEHRPRRYASHYFFAASDALKTQRDPVHDGSEIHEARWVTPAEMLARRDRGEITLAPPTFVTLWRLHHEALSILDETPQRILPKPMKVSEGVISLYPGDGGYNTSELLPEGPQHRAYLLDSGWRYEAKS